MSNTADMGRGGAGDPKTGSSILYGEVESRRLAEENGASPATRDNQIAPEAQVAVADVIELDLDDRQGDLERDQAREDLLAAAESRLRANQDLLDEQIGPVIDVLEMDLADREGDREQDEQAEKLLSEALQQLRVSYERHVSAGNPNLT